MHSNKRLMCDDCGRPKSCFACKGKALAELLQSIEDPHQEDCRCEECKTETVVQAIGSDGKHENEVQG